MTDTEMQRLIDEAQAALDDHFRPRLVKAQLNMTDIVERLRRYYPSNPEKENDLYRTIQEAAAEIERLREQLRAEHLHWEHQNGLLEAEIERERGILQFHETASKHETEGLRVEIERLRDEKAYLMRVVDMESDAANEIERLRALLR